MNGYATGIDEHAGLDYSLRIGSKMALNEQIRAARSTLHESLPQFARRFDVSGLTVWRWEKGIHSPSGPAKVLLNRLFDQMRTAAQEGAAE